MTKRKVTLYFHDSMLEETQREALRLDRSISWVIQAAWRIAREEVRKLPASELKELRGGARGNTAVEPVALPRRVAGR